MISFVGAGPGAPDLITLRGASRLAEAEVVVWAASLVPEALLAHCRPGVELHDSAGMTLEQVLAVYAAHPGARIVRLHSGDPTVYSAVAEQVDWCIANERSFEIVPGVSSMTAAAAAAGAELTVPRVAQSVVLTRLARRTAASMPEGEGVAAFAPHGSTMAIFLSASRPEELRDELLAAGSAYGPDTPALIAHRVTWPDERVLRTTVGRLAGDLRALGAGTTVMVLVGEALGGRPAPARSHVYSPAYTHSFRAAAGPDADVPIAVVGLHGGESFGAAAAAAIREADVLVGATRHLDMVANRSAERIELGGAMDAVLARIGERAASGRRVCVLASGDPGFFGIVRLLSRTFDPGRLRVHPAPSSVSLAFARLGLSWDGTTVISAHGRPLAAAVEVALREPSVAVLTSPDSPPQAVGAALLAAGCGPRRAAVVSRLGEAGESVHETDLPGLAAGEFDPLSVVVLTAPDPPPDGMSLAWGLAEDRFAHRDGMITKAEVRAVALGKLALPAAGVLWDVGAGSGSVGIECARLRPGLRVVAIERDPASAQRVHDNAATHGVSIDVVEGAAPEAYAGLPDPDRVFVGGGGLAALDAALTRLRPAGVVVATYALVDRAVAARERLGSMLQLNVSRAVPIPSAGVRLAAENPVFVCWGGDPR